MATFTSNAAVAGIQPKGGHVGVQTEWFTVAATGSAAANDVVLACKIPNGANVLDAAIRMGHRADTQATINVFLARIGEGSGSAIASMGTQVLSATAGGVLWRPGNVWAPGTKIPLLDTPNNSYALLKVSIQAGTTTTSFSLAGFITWTMEDAYL